MFINTESFNFKEELNKAMQQDIAKNDICLISHEKLDPFKKITLSCNHSFNYDNLIQSLEKNKHYFNNRCYYNTIKYKCPYCRDVPNQLIPYIPEICNKKLIGINWGSKDKIKTNLCKFINSRKNPCNKICLNNFCEKHYQKSLQKKPLTVKELRIKAKQLNLKNYSRLKKAELILLIEENKNI
jgi:hypothetical protein|tara:strand:+ start:529 stop:1080 length:552 start_codon:yes stop_codon:yes gene_type:complete